MWEDDTWDLKFAAKLPSNARFLRAVDTWQKGMKALEGDKMDVAINLFADALLLSERGAMVSGKWVEALPQMTTRLAARGRDDPKALVLSAWVNLFAILTSRVVSMAEDRGAERDAHYKRAISCYEILLELEPEVAGFDVNQTGRVWLLLGGAQQLLSENSPVCYASWHKAHALAPDVCSDAKFLLGASEYNHGNWGASRTALEAFVKQCGLDSRLSSAAYFMLTLLSFKTTPPVDLALTKLSPAIIAESKTYYELGMRSELLREAWMPKGRPSILRREATELMHDLVKKRLSAAVPRTPFDSVSKRFYTLILLVSFLLITGVGMLISFVFPPLGAWLDTLLYSGSDRAKWIYWGLFMLVRMTFTFGLFFVLTSALDTAAMRAERNALVTEAQRRKRAGGEPSLVG